MKEIILKRGEMTIVDDEDFDFLNQWKWHLNNSGYAARGIKINGKYKLILMHREILNTPNDMDSDHINRDRLDNRKCNLRICNRSQNQHNRTINKNNTSGAKGVRVESDRLKFRAVINFNGKRIHIGKYNTIEEASQAYIEKAKEICGEFACIG